MWFYCRLDAARSERACGKDAAKMLPHFSRNQLNKFSVFYNPHQLSVNTIIIHLFIVLLIMPTQINSSSYKDWHSIVINVLIV